MKNKVVIFLKSYRTTIVLAGFVSVLFWFLLPDQLFNDPLSTVVSDRNGELLGARIAADGQWRFPEPDVVPDKFAQALITFEDQYFYTHPGINPISLGRALITNLQEGRIVSGGSTLTMQVLRLSRKGKQRTLSQKLIESILSIRYELTTNKTEILIDYAANAPFGGNVVGLEAAAWRYFNTDPENLTYGEAALLAVLPNAPGLIHPGRNRNLLKEKRDRLLFRMMEKQLIDSLTCILACAEELPEKPQSLPNLVPHLTDRFQVDQPEDKIGTTLIYDLQRRANDIASKHHDRLAENQVHNLACILMEVESGNVVAYIGNTGAYKNKSHGNNVDVVRSPRSTGSILKPFLFASILDKGVLLPTALVPDVPVRFYGYAPKNYDREYEGAVPAYQALERSLNIPSVIMLKDFGVERFLSSLKSLGFSTFVYSPEHYGLSLILGGAEATLWELSGAFGSLARILNNYNNTNGNYFKQDLHAPVLLKERTVENDFSQAMEEGIISAGSIYVTLESLLKVNRPDEQSLWYLLDSSRPVAWKTGTSYGFRDAWAIGLTPEYLVAVWVGNADGEGRTGLTGLTAAAPLMFDLFGTLPATSWFEKPLDDLVGIEICKKSGYQAGQHCMETDTILVSPIGRTSQACPYHKIVHLSADRQYRADSECVPISDIVSEPWFVLPPLMELFYKRKDPFYRELPPLKSGCKSENIEELELVYPVWGSTVLIPLELDGSMGNMVMEVAHRNPSAKVYWHIDNRYLGTTISVHQLALNIEPGEHFLTVVDNQGFQKTVKFTVLGKKSLP